MLLNSAHDSGHGRECDHERVKRLKLANESIIRGNKPTLFLKRERQVQAIVNSSMMRKSEVKSVV